MVGAGSGPALTGPPVLVGVGPALTGTLVWTGPVSVLTGTPVWTGPVLTGTPVRTGMPVLGLRTPVLDRGVRNTASLYRVSESALGGDTRGAAPLEYDSSGDQSASAPIDVSRRWEEEDLKTFLGGGMSRSAESFSAERSEDFAISFPSRICRLRSLFAADRRSASSDASHIMVVQVWHTRQGVALVQKMPTSLRQVRVTRRVLVPRSQGMSVLIPTRG